MPDWPLNTWFVLAFGLLLLTAGVYHFVNPKFYYPFMPGWFPKALANALGGGAEVVIGGLLLFPATRRVGLYAAAALMLIFLPLHVLDLLRERPLMGSKAAAVLRLAVQFGLIYWLWWSAGRG